MRYSDYKKEVFAENPEVKEAYDRLAPQYEVICKAIASRKAVGLTQKQVSENFENGNSNPSLDFLQKMASCMGKTLHIIFE